MKVNDMSAQSALPNQEQDRLTDRTVVENESVVDDPSAIRDPSIIDPSNPVNNAAKADIAKLLDHYQTDANAGLTAASAQTRLQQYGPNEIASEPATGSLELFLRQMRSSVVV